MENELIYGSKIICTFQVDPRSVVSSGTHSCPTLRFWAQATRSNKVELIITKQREKRHYSMVSHDLALYLGKGRKYGGSFLTSILCSGLPLRSWWSNPGHLEFIAPLDFFKLDAIERNREKDSVLVISGAVLLAIHPNQIRNSESNLEQIDGYIEAELELTYRIAQSDWVDKILAVLGHRRFHMLELDFTHCEITKALEYISRAESAISEGRLINAAIGCRDMADYLSKQYLSFSKDDQRHEKWIRASDYFKHFASMSGHQEGLKVKYENFVFNRPDVEFTLILAKALIRYAQTLKKEGKVNQEA